MRKILFHICCGPCATASVRRLTEEGYEVIGYYYNPNIHPEFEYKKRLKEAGKFARQNRFRLIIGDYQPKEYFEAIRSLERVKAKRCQKCWKLRLQKTTEKAKELGIVNFGTTLRISPHQDQEKLKEVAENIALKCNLRFYDKNLVNSFRKSVQISKSQKMYRQKYCGCIFSKDYC